MRTYGNSSALTHLQRREKVWIDPLRPNPPLPPQNPRTPTPERQNTDVAVTLQLPGIVQLGDLVHQPLRKAIEEYTLVGLFVFYPVVGPPEGLFPTEFQARDF